MFNQKQENSDPFDSQVLIISIVGLNSTKGVWA